MLARSKSTSGIVFIDRRTASLAAAWAGALAALAAPLLVFGQALPQPMAVVAIVGLALATLSAIDSVSFRLPDVLTVLLAIAGLVAAGLKGAEALGAALLAASVAGGALVAVSLVYRMARGRAGLGLGDAKLFAAAGAWLGPHLLSPALLVACASALACAGVRRLAGEDVGSGTRLAFGPHLAIGFWLVWLYAPAIVCADGGALFTCAT